MEVNFSRCMKELGRLSTEELASIFTKSLRSEDEKNQMVEMLKELLDSSNELNVNSYIRKSKLTTKSRSSKKQISKEVVIKMRQKLADYEDSDAIDRWEIEFTVGGDYSNVDLREIKELHARYAFLFYLVVIATVLILQNICLLGPICVSIESL